MLKTRARDNACFIAFCNLVGGQDELIFDGHSLVLDDEGAVLARAPGFEEACSSSTSTRRSRSRGGCATCADARSRAALDPQDVAGRAHRLAAAASGGRAPLVAARRGAEQMRLRARARAPDYVRKNGFSDVVIGVSGGIDSAVTAALCVEALGPEHVHCVSMPSRYSSEETRADARRVAESLGASFLELPIGPVVDAFEATLAEAFAGREPDLTEENIQARTRGVLLMALSNKFGWLLVATGNKSELSVGYATLYGDMAGGFALLKDVYKTDVFRLARHLNERAGRELIPVSTIERAPSAELRPDQRDEDSLPPYARSTRARGVRRARPLARRPDRHGFDPDVVERALALVDRAEYKRRQAPPGVKLARRRSGATGALPITNRWPG